MAKRDVKRPDFKTINEIRPEVMVEAAGVLGMAHQPAVLRRCSGTPLMIGAPVSRSGGVSRTWARTRGSVTLVPPGERDCDSTAPGSPLHGACGGQHVAHAVVAFMARVLEDPSGVRP